MRDRYYGLKGEIDGLKRENSYLERRNQELRQEVDVLKEDVKDLKTLKKVYGSKRVNEIIKETADIVYDKQSER